MKNLLSTIAIVSALASFAQPTTCSASDQIPGAKQSQPIAIIGATIHTIDDAPIENATLVFEDGRIVAIGKSVTLPENCEKIDGAGKHVFPSLIEPYSDIGLVEINSIRASIDSSETGMLNPNVRAAAAFNPDSELIPVTRSNGILLAVTAPEGSVVNGRSALMMLDGWTWEDMTLQPDLGMHIRWPRSEEGIQELDTFFRQAKRYSEASESKKSDRRLESMQPVLAGEMPIFVAADQLEQIEAAVSFATKHAVKLVVVGGNDAPHCAELLKLKEIPVIVGGIYRVPARRNSAFDESYTLPKRLQEAGIQYCISAGGRFGASNLRNLPYNAATAVAYGLTPEEALRAITLSTAEILGVEDRVGSLAVGKDATLFLADGNILETATQVTDAFIQGRRVDLDNKHKMLYRKYSAKYEQMK